MVLINVDNPLPNVQEKWEGIARFLGSGNVVLSTVGHGTYTNGTFSFTHCAALRSNSNSLRGI